MALDLGMLGVDDLNAQVAATARVAAWLPNTTLVLCDLVDEAAHDLVAIASRTILRRQVQRLEEWGYQAKAASELDFDL